MAPNTRTGSDQTGTEGAVRALRKFRRVFNCVKTHFRQTEKRAGLGGAQVWALNVVRNRPAMSIKVLGADEQDANIPLSQM